MSHEDILKRLSETLEIYDEDRYFYNFERKAYNDDNVLIKNGVYVKDIITAFQLEKKDFYKKLKSKTHGMNKYDMIKDLVNEKKPYKIFKTEYQLKNYDFGYDKYHELCIQQMQETHKYDAKINKYKMTSYTTGGRDLKKHNLTYNDLVDSTYNSIKKVVKKIQQLEKTYAIKTEE
jgi:hypothetical protein